MRHGPKTSGNWTTFGSSSCGEGAESRWDCTCDYSGFMERMGDALRAASTSRETGGTETR